MSEILIQKLFQEVSAGKNPDSFNSSEANLILQTIQQLDAGKIRVAEKTTDGKDKEKRLLLHVKSEGNAIGFCHSYIELTNTSTGELIKLPVRHFTILPGFERSIYFSLPAQLTKGKYSVMAVIDYGSKEDIKAAELELQIE